MPTEIEWTGKVMLEPLKRKKPTMYFVNSMGDLFHEDVPDEWINRVFAVMAMCPQHTFQVLTKRADRMREYFSRLDSDRSQISDELYKLRDFCTDSVQMVRAGRGDLSGPWPLPNVWLGVSVEDQASANERIPHLLETPAAVRFVSAEPLLGPVSFRWASWDNWKDENGNRRPRVDQYDGLRMISWLICGGESGPNARPMHPDWARGLRDQCQDAGVPFFMKQMGGVRKPFPQIPDDLLIREMPTKGAT